MSTSRERILARLRRHAPMEPQGLPPIPEPTLYADLPDADARLACFQQRLAELAGECYTVADTAAAARKLLQLLPAEGQGIVQRHPLINPVVAQLPAEHRPDIYEERLPDSPSMSHYTWSLTIADWLIARTGSIVCRSTAAAGRRLSVLPPMHIVLATADQLTGSLEEALADLQTKDDAWSLATVITGPARTADIEKILVLGAHGPKRLAVLLLPPP